MITPLERAVSSLAKILGVAGAALGLGTIAWTVRAPRPVPEAVVALILTILVLGAQWVFLRTASRDRDRAVMWVMVSYLTKIALVVAGLYIPRVLGMDVRFPAVVVIVAVLVAAAAEVLVMSRMRQFNVDPPASGDAD